MNFFKKIIVVFILFLISILTIEISNAKEEKEYKNNSIKSISKIKKRKYKISTVETKVDEKENTKNEKNKSKEHEINLNIGGLSDFQYFYTKQLNEYEKNILPNGLNQSPSDIRNSYLIQDGRNTLNLLGKIDINPEINYYNVSEDKERKKIISAGLKISQPFFNASKNVDPRFASQEYVYVKTKYLQLQIGSVSSAGSRMRVDSQKIASGAGGIYGTWWRYVSLPVFNTSNVVQNSDVLNSLSPIYILYPTLPNEAGFTAQRLYSDNVFLNENFINGNVNISNPVNGLTTQGFPTQGAYSNKISLYSKRINGFSLGLSYSPTTANTGFLTRSINRQTQKTSSLSGGFVRNYTSIGLDYRKQFDKYGLGIAMSFTYEYGESSPLKYGNNDTNIQSTSVISNSSYYDRHNLNAYAIGAQIVYKNYSVAYSYGDWGYSLLNKYMISQDGTYQFANKNKKSYYHTLGVGADYGFIKFGATYMCSSFSGYKLDVWSIGTDFKSIKLKYFNLQPYLEYLGYVFHTRNIQPFLNSKTTYKASASRGYVITLGLKVVF